MRWSEGKEQRSSHLPTVINWIPAGTNQTAMAKPAPGEGPRRL